MDIVLTHLVLVAYQFQKEFKKKTFIKKSHHPEFKWYHDATFCCCYKCSFPILTLNLCFLWLLFVSLSWLWQILWIKSFQTGVCVDLIEKYGHDLAPSWVLSPCDFIKAGRGCSAPWGLTHPDLKEDAERNCEWMDKTGNEWRNTFFFFFFSSKCKSGTRKMAFGVFSPGFCKYFSSF